MSQKQRVVIRLKVEVSDPNIKVVVKVDKVVMVKKYVEDKMNTGDLPKLPNNLKIIDASEIISKVCEYLKLKRDILLSKNRTRGYVKCRQMIAHILYNVESYTLIEAGDCLNRDHTTVGYLISRHLADHDQDEKYRIKYNQMVEDLMINIDSHAKEMRVRPNYKGKYSKT
jgi:chromosomal replication initiation ATPase DnaA